MAGIREYLIAIFLILTVVLAACPLQAQEPAPALPPAAPSSTATSPSTEEVRSVVGADSHRTREEFRELLDRHPPQVGRVLKLDPTLFSNPAWLANYPTLASFLASHPEVAHTPTFYLDGVGLPADYAPDTASVRAWRDAMEGISIFAVMLTIVGALTWMVRTLIDHRRWSRMTRIQAEVHGKLMDRFSSNEDLLTYIQTPAGKRFLESTPISVDAGPRAVSAPVGRMLWSVQVGVVLFSLGLGLQYVAGSIDKEVAGPMSAMGVLAIAIGLGFVFSAVVSFFISWKLGLWGPKAEQVSLAE